MRRHLDTRTRSYDHSRLHRSYVVCNVVNKDYCSVTNCNSSAPNKRVSSRISFHKIPKQKQSHLRIVWKRFIQRGKPRNYTVSDNAKICSNHFRSSDLITTLTGKRILAKNAVPFEPVKSSVLGARKIRKPSKDRAPVGTLKTRTSTVMFSATTCISAPNLPDLVQTPTLNEHDYQSSGSQPSNEEMLETAQMRIVQLEAALQQKAPFRWFQMKPDSTVKFYTGFPSFEILVKTCFATYC
ncbi:uncharacterized protein LOC122963951 [Acropora millepora]|uniref:uncharacterized protein LOC122963951 n=1 Tax=Acropora millepora TaxID=45264 RepID=UPI001CF2C4F4|nr:uncharacterized protein LOC122963951 [Acropora millepora]